MVKSSADGNEEPVAFRANGFFLQCRLHMPENDRPAFVVGSHGLFSNGDSPKQLALARACSGAGIAFFRFDHRGCGKSSGRFEQETDLPSRRRDLLSAVDTLLQRTDLASRFGLFGSSFGGAVCLSAAADASASALVVNAAPVRSRTLGEAAVIESGPPHIDESFYREKLLFDVSAGLARLRAVLVFHGDRDRVVPVENAVEIYQQVGEPKKRIIFSGGDHLMSRRSHQIRFVRESTEWFRALLSPPSGHGA